MPTGVLSFGTIATRLRAAADSPTLASKTIDDLAACAQTLEAGMPSTKQLRAVLTAVADVDEANPDLELRRCVSSLNYWVNDWRNGAPAKPTSKPQWMLDNEATEAAPVKAENIHAWAIIGAMEVVLDEIAQGNRSDEVFEDLNALVRTLKRLA